MRIGLAGEKVSHGGGSEMALRRWDVLHPNGTAFIQISVGKYNASRRIYVQLKFSETINALLRSQFTLYLEC